MRGALPEDSHPLDRLLAGGRHCRLLMAWRPPIGLKLPELTDFERVACLARPAEPMLGTVVADALRLPFVEALFDRALVTSPLPGSRAREELRELWRVLTPASLTLLVVKARRPWQWQAPGWLQDDLAPLLADTMFDVLDWRIETLPQRFHLILVGKADGLAPTMIGRVEEVTAPAVAM
ncbi:MAG: hypothetical protein RL490_927 [Pseudomonadota bacterium]|jgi:hypothetical protein